MSAAVVFDVVLALVLIATAARTVLARDAFAAIASFVAFGVVMMIAWMRLRAPDVALTEGAVSAGLSGFLLFSAQARLRGSTAALDVAPAGSAAKFAAAVIGALVTAGLAVLVLAPADPAPSLAPQAAAHRGAIGLGNTVNAVLLGFRALDTLLEKIVVVLALAGVWSLSADDAWPRAPLVSADPRHPALVLLGRVLPPFGIVVAVYLLWNGADEPGGAFASAAVLAAMWLLAVLTGAARLPPVSSRRLRAAIVAGPLAFIAAACLGVVTAGAFLAYPEAWAKPIIVSIEVALVLSVAVMLTLMVAGPPKAEAA